MKNTLICSDVFPKRLAALCGASFVFISAYLAAIYSNVINERTGNASSFKLEQVSGVLIEDVSLDRRSRFDRRFALQAPWSSFQRDKAMAQPVELLKARKILESVSPEIYLEHFQSSLVD